MVTVVLTRPQGKNQVLAQALSQRGVRCLQLPALQITPTLASLPDSFHPQNYDLLVFVSAQAVQYYLRALTSAGFDFAQNQAIATVGAASAAPFYKQGLNHRLRLIHPAATHPYQDSEALWDLLLPSLDQFERVLLVRGQQGREWLSQQFIQHHKELSRCIIYQRRPVQWSTESAIQLQRDLVKPQTVTFLLTSSESTQAIYDNMVRLGLETAWKQACFVAIHPRIADKLQRLCGLSEQQMQDQVHICAPSQMAMQEALLAAALPK